MNMWSEAQWSEVLFSYLTAGWYDWSVSEQLNQSNTHCWSVTAGYYSHYILSATLLRLYRAENYQNKNEIEDVAGSHAKLCNFLRDREIRNQRGDQRGNQ